MNILERITEHRLARNWSEYALAEKSGVPQSTISSWYKKNMTPSLVNLEKICKAFDITVSSFLSNSNMVELTPEQHQFFLSWSRLTAEQKASLDSLIKTFTN